ncbi:pyruvate dehydrogenase X component [Mycena floridula]|nr:pyruvate dehydrogenase X component [Mycena floridula]
MASRALSRASGSAQRYGSRMLHQSRPRLAVTNLEMPAMSPTMTEGGIASWKKKEGESFSAGDVLLEIETDKATIDVEAQEDGIMGKILLADGTKNVQVGKVIALLAEEGDDISNLEAPKEKEAPKVAEPPQPTPESPKASDSEPTPKPAHSGSLPSHSRPFFPSVHRLLLEHGVSDAESIKGSGVRGMLTKGDVLAFLGMASSPFGTFKESPSHLQAAGKAPANEEPKPLDGIALRSLIASTMLKATMKARNASASSTALDFDSIIADYLPASPKPSPSPPLSRPPPPKSTSFLDGLI